MKLKVSSQNEFAVIPDIGENLSLPDNQRFKVMIRRLNNTLHSGRWASYGEGGAVFINVKEKLRDHIVRLVNPPTILIDGKEEKELTIDDILSDKFSDLDSIVDQIMIEVNKISIREGIETKK